MFRVSQSILSARPSGRFQITDAGLKELAPLTQLRTLELLACRVTGAGLKELAPLEHLESLSLKRTTITDAGLKAMTRLTVLSLSVVLILCPITVASERADESAERENSQATFDIGNREEPTIIQRLVVAKSFLVAMRRHRDSARSDLPVRFLHRKRPCGCRQRPGCCRWARPVQFARGDSCKTELAESSSERFVNWRSMVNR